MLLYILLAVIVVSLISLVGIFFFFMRTKTINRAIPVLVAFASGSMLGAAFLHMLPEALESYGTTTSASVVFPIVIAGMLVFFMLERILYWHHCHAGVCEVHPFVYLNLVGDGIHNFVDGMVIAASFMINPALGVVATVAVIAHEVPQELGDFGILLFGGFSKRKALGFNFISATMAIIGAMTAYFYLGMFGLSPLLIAFAAGGFIYIACVDLMPRLQKELDREKSVIQLFLFITGIAMIQGISMLVG